MRKHQEASAEHMWLASITINRNC